MVAKNRAILRVLQAVSLQISFIHIDHIYIIHIDIYNTDQIDIYIGGVAGEVIIMGLDMKKKSGKREKGEKRKIDRRRGYIFEIIVLDVSLQNKTGSEF